MKTNTITDIRSGNSGKIRGKNNIIFLLTVKSAVAFLYNHSTLRQGLEKMRHHGYTAMPVITEDGTYVGTVSEGDFLWHIIDSGENSMKLQENYTVSTILRRGWNPAVNIRATMQELLMRVTEQNFVPVVDDRGMFMGIITRKSVIQHYCDNETADKRQLDYTEQSGGNT